jgi:integrase
MDCGTVIGNQMPALPRRPRRCQTQVSGTIESEQDGTCCTRDACRVGQTGSWPAGAGAGARRPGLPRQRQGAGAGPRRAQRAALLIFTGSRGGALRRSNFRRAVRWYEAVAAIGVPGLHFHDLRHTGNSLAAATGASLRDLMDRMGHDSARAALIYQHKSAAAGQVIADALSAQIEALEQQPGDRPSTG